MKCPNCGFDHDETGFGRELSGITLPKKQRRVLNRLIAARGGYVSRENLIALLYSDDADGGPATVENQLSGYVTHLRHRIAGTPYRIGRMTDEGFRLVRIAQGGSP